MSHEGKLIRGLKWYSNRDLDGNLPDDITKDPNKMVDVEYYTDFLKGRDEKEVMKDLAYLRYLEKVAGANKLQMIKEIKDRLSKPAGLLTTQEPKKKSKKEEG